MTSSAHCRVVQALMLVAWLLGPSTSLFAQATIRLYSGVAPGSEGWSLPESSVPGVPGFEQYGPWLTNVAEPTLTVFRPDPGTSTGTAVIVCPGGGFHFLSMENEGVKVAEWLRARGITAFVLKYRVLQTTPEHMGRVIAESVKHIDEEMAPVFPLAMADARSALGYVRGHAVEFGILPTRLGVIGFSAGGMLAVSLAVTSPDGRGPDFVAPIYTHVNDMIRPLVVPKSAPPAFIVMATDDDLGFAPESTELYNAWIAAGRSAELHAYAKGGHGFAMLRRGLPVDTWPERFEDWLRFKGWLKRPQ
jgi:acetyl esterase/lipase